MAEAMHWDVLGDTLVILFDAQPRGNSADQRRDGFNSNPVVPTIWTTFEPEYTSRDSG